MSEVDDRLPEDARVFNAISAPVWISTYEPEKVEFLWANDAAVKLWNKKSMEDLVSTDIFNGRSEAVQKLHTELYQQVQVNMEKNTCRRTMYPGGQSVTVDCEFAPLYVSMDGVKKIVSIVRAVPVVVDEGEKEVNRSHEMLRHSPIMTVLFSMQGDVIQSNVAASFYYTSNDRQKMISLDDMVSTCRWDEGVTPEQLSKKLKRMKLGDTPVKAQVMKIAAGEEAEIPSEYAVNQVWHDVQFIPTTDPVTGSPALLLIESDISELEHMKAVEAQLLEAHKQKEAFFAAISHELRTPLNGIIGLTESMIDDDDLNESAQHTLGIILKSATRLNVLINDILDAASLKQGTLKIRMGPVDVNETIDQVCEHMKILSRSNVELIKLNDPKIPMARGDHQRIFQILTNLLGNSLKFTHEGHVKIWADYDETLDVIKFNVEDTGIGIPEDKIESVFKPFSQGDMSTTRSYEGTGLGLALVQSLVAGHGGDIFVESEVSKGTKLSFTLQPWSEDDLTMDSRESSGSSGGATGSSSGATGSSSRTPSGDGGISGGSDDEKLTVMPRMEGRPDVPKKIRGNRRGKSHGLAGSEEEAEVKRAEYTIRAGGQGAKGKEPEAVAPGPKSQQGPETTRKVPNISVETGESRRGQAAGMMQSPMHVSPVGRTPMVSSMGGERNATISESRDLKGQNLKLLIEIDELRDELQEFKKMKYSTKSDQTETGSSAGNLSGSFTSGGWTGGHAGTEVQSRRTSHCPSEASDIDSSLKKPHAGMKQAELLAMIDRRDEIIFNLRQANEQLSVTDRSHKSDVQVGSSSIPSASTLFGKVEIMCVDDNEVNHEVIGRALEPCGYQVTHCQSGKSCLEILKDRSHLPDLILIDLMMPEMNGTECVRKIRAQFPRAHLPIIMLSARSDERSIVNNLMPAGDDKHMLCNDYVVKPFRSKELVARINALLKTKQGWKVELSAANNAAAMRQLLPQQVADRMIKGIINVDHFPTLSCLVAEVSGLSAIATEISIEKYLGYLKRLYKAFDDIVHTNGGYRVDMPGEMYVVVIGHEYNQLTPASLLRMGEAILATAKEFNLGAEPSLQYPLPVTAGICTGPAYASVVGTRIPRYVFFGEAVIGATALQADAPDNCILLCQRTFDAVQDGKYSNSVAFGRPDKQMYIAAIGDFQAALEDADSGTGVDDSSASIVRIEVDNEIFPRRSSNSGSASDGSAYVRTMHMQLLKQPSLVTALQSAMAKMGQSDKNGTDDVLQELESCSNDLEARIKEVDQLTSANLSLKKEIKKLEHERDKARREVSSTNVTMRSLKTEVKGLREVMPTDMPERKAIVQSDSGQGTASSGSSPSEQYSSGDSCSQLEGEEHRVVSLNELAGMGRLGVKSSSSGSSRSDNSARSDTEPRVLCHEELYGQVEVMSVDDTPMNHLVIERILKRTEYKMTSCMDGVLFLQMIQERGYLPDILLLDVMMPGISGHQVCQKLRELYPMTTLPVIMISAKSNQENILEGFNSGCVDYVVKPFSRHELLARIKVHLRQKDLYFKSYKRRKPSPVPRSLSTTEGPLLTDAQRMTAAMVETIPMATVLIADICQYEQLSSIMSAEDMYLTVNQLFVEAEKVASHNKLTLIEHAGDYLVFVAVDDSDPSLAAKSCVSAALEMLKLAQSIKTKSGKSLGIACGIQSGVVFSCDDCGACSRGDNPGTEKSKLNYFGKTVNQACEIEEVGRSMTIGIGAGTRELIGTAFKTEPWNWGKSMKRYIIVDSVCDWKAGLEYGKPEFATGSESENEGNTDVVATSGGHPARLKPSARKSRNHKILELELHKEKDRALKLTEKASQLESEVAELKVVVEKLQASKGTGDERKAEVSALMDQVKRLESERRILEKKLASKTMESTPLISMHGETFTMNGNKGASVTLGASSSIGEIGGIGRRPSTHSPPASIDSRLQSAMQGGSASFKDAKKTRSSRDVKTTHESDAPGARSRSSSTSSSTSSTRSGRTPMGEALSENAAMIRAKLFGGNDALASVAATGASVAASRAPSSSNLSTSPATGRSLSPPRGGRMSPMGKPPQSLQSSLQSPMQPPPHQPKRATGPDDGFSGKLHTPWASIQRSTDGGTSDADITKELKMENAELRVERARLRAKVLDLAKDNEALTLTINRIDPASLAFFGIDERQTIVTRSPAAATAEAKPASGDHSSHPLTPEIRKELMAELKSDIMEVIREATSPVKNSHSTPMAERARHDNDSSNDLKEDNTGSFDTPVSRFLRNSASFGSNGSGMTAFHHSSRGGTSSPDLSMDVGKGRAFSVDMGKKKQMSSSMDSFSGSLVSAASEPEHKVSVQISPDGKFIISDGLAASAGAEKGADVNGFEKLACTVILKNLIVPENGSSSGVQGTMRTITEIVGRWGVVAQPVKLAKDKNDGTSLAVVEMRSQEQAAKVVAGMDGAIYNGNVIKASLPVPSGIDWKGFQSFGLKL